MEPIMASVRRASSFMWLTCAELRIAADALEAALVLADESA
jgi:hypothetical protein